MTKRLAPGTFSEQEPTERKERTVLDEAKGLVHGARNAAYGAPIHDFSRQAVMLNGLYLTRLQQVRDGIIKPEEFFQPNDPPKIQIIKKMSRSMHAPKRDHWTDTAGYAETGDWVEEDMSKVYLQRIYTFDTEGDENTTCSGTFQVEMRARP